MPRKRPTDRTSSLNKYLICDHCDEKFYTKNKFMAHKCVRGETNFTCKWCNVKFQSKACLANHARSAHGDMSYSTMSKMPSSEIRKCTVCSKMFAELFQLRYHIRRQHFNMKAKVPYWLQKKVNQVWFENVLNCDNVLEMRKAGPNTLVLRRLAATSSIRVADHATEELDVTHLYPTGRKYEPVECKLCGKRYGKRDLAKHTREVHAAGAPHRCSKCKLQFKRLYIYLKHVCGRGRRRPADAEVPA